MRPRTNSSDSLSRFSVPLLPKPHLCAVTVFCALRIRAHPRPLHTSSKRSRNRFQRRAAHGIICFLFLKIVEQPPQVVPEFGCMLRSQKMQLFHNLILRFRQVP